MFAIAQRKSIKVFSIFHIAHFSVLYVFIALAMASICLFRLFLAKSNAQLFSYHQFVCERPSKIKLHRESLQLYTKLSASAISSWKCHFHFCKSISWWHFLRCLSAINNMDANTKEEHRDALKKSILITLDIKGVKNVKQLRCENDSCQLINNQFHPSSAL